MSFVRPEGSMFPSLTKKFHVKVHKLLDEDDFNARRFHLYTLRVNSFFSTEKLNVTTIQTTSLFHEPNPVHRTQEQMLRWLQDCLSAARIILKAEKLPLTRAGDLVILTSSWDNLFSCGRSSFGVERQLEYIRRGMTLNDVDDMESKGISFQEMEEFRHIPKSVRDALYLPLSPEKLQANFKPVAREPYRVLVDDSRLYLNPRV